MKKSRKSQILTTRSKHTHLSLLATLLAGAILAALPARAQTFTPLYTFTGGIDGANPMGALAIDGSGNLYGTTYTGGTATGCAPGTGCGTVFEFTKAGHLKVLYTFARADDGGNPTTGLIRDSSGNLYGNADYAASS